MRIHKTILILLAVCLSAFLMQSCATKDTPSADEFTETVYQPAYASGFRILRIPGAESTLLEVSNPWQGADSVKRLLFIARNGETAPAGVMSVAGKAARIVCMSTSQIGLLSAFGADSLVAGVSGMEWVTNPLVKSRRDSIADVGYEGAIDYERMLSARPDLVLLFGVGGASAMEDKLSELGIPYAYVGDYLEQSPLGRAEWMVALGELSGKRQRAEKAFAPIPEAYDSLRAIAADSASRRPLVMLNAPYSDSWFMPPVSSYMVRLISDAGGDYIYPENQSGVSQPIDMEQAVEMLGRADLWLQPGQARTLAELRAMAPKVRFGNPVYNSSADFWESGVARPDLVLSDLVTIMQGDSVSSLNYFQRLE